MVLPQNVYTEWYWSGSLSARVVNRAYDGSEGDVIADMISQEAEFAVKHSWKALTGEELRTDDKQYDYD